MRSDAVRDLIDRLLAAAHREGTLSESLAIEVERQWRRDYRGERIYVASVPVPDAVKSVVVEQYKAGVPIPKIESSAGISRATLYRLIKKG